MNDLKNYYEILELTPNCSQDEIDQGYIKAKNAYSADSAALYSLMSAEECELMLTHIEEAYDILSSPVKRRQYDEARGFVRSSEEVFEAQRLMPSVDTNKSMHKSITKIVTRQQFTLEYNINPQMEQEIEQTTVFTGEALKKIREYKNVDIQRMADMTKVSKSYLIKIESEDMTHLPALVYVRGFVFQYAKCLKLNPELVATSYVHHIKKKNNG